MHMYLNCESDVHVYIINRVDGLSFRSKPDLLWMHKKSTNKYISIYRKRKGKWIKGRIHVNIYIYVYIQ